MSPLLAQLQRHANERPDAPAYRQGSTTLTYRNLVGGIATLTNSLRRELQPNDVVLLSCSNQLAYPVAFLATLAAGCTVFPVSVEMTEVELRRAVVESAAVAVIGDARTIELLRGSLKYFFSISNIPLNGNDRLEPATLGDLFLQSSGTTGVPKIVRRSGLSLDRAAEVMAEAVGFRPDDSVMMTVPLAHSYGLEHGLLAPIWAGSCTVLANGLDLPIVLPELSSGAITIFPGVPSSFEMLAGLADSELKMPALHTAYSAGAPLPRAIFDAFHQRFGVRVGQLYGATEIGSVTFNKPIADFDPASVGQPMRDVSVRILNPDDSNQTLPRGNEGTVAVRASSMFSGYLNGSAELVDGHFLTGDLGRLDEQNRLFITGRIKLLIDVGGMKVNPQEVEAVLQLHPAVEACVVVPIAQSQTVFRLKAVITLRDQTVAVPIDELRALARSQLSSYKIPRWFEVRKSLPRSASGKILRHLVEKA
ncbi:MAG TPA: AMP-binding protein [Tepidisphaeraceae bacterium]|nr:AMP-binding protein [Tepidisphaeraceae bacterium]